MFAQIFVSLRGKDLIYCTEKESGLVGGETSRPPCPSEHTHIDTQSGGPASRPQRNLPASQVVVSLSSIPVSSASEIDHDADFVYDYHTLRIGGLTFAGVIVFLSILLLAGNSIRRCGKAKSSPPKEDS
ncbi:FXYD domain-containing ion transport regulator 12 [Arapaima gigas]